VPIDTFLLDEEPMTQTVIGLSQAFPPLGMTGARSARWNALSDSQKAAIEDRVLEVKRQVRRVWLELYYQHKARKLVEESESVFEQFAKITQYQYRAGRGNQQHVVRAQLELSLLRDRETAIETEKERAMATLAKWVGALDGDLSMEFPKLPPAPGLAEVESTLDRHPALVQKDYEVRAARHGIDAEESRYWPGWMVDLSYGKRDAVDSDVFTAMIQMNLPFFTGSRQDKQVESKRSLLMAQKQASIDKRRMLSEQLNDNFANYQRITERLQYFKTMLVPQAEQNTKAALNAYQSGVSDFGELVRARLTELDSRLKELRLIVNREKSKADLLYLAGGRT
ncbi:TolC family protein, partial [Kaarinaea lacus]